MTIFYLTSLIAFSVGSAFATDTSPNGVDTNTVSEVITASPNTTPTQDNVDDTDSTDSNVDSSEPNQDANVINLDDTDNNIDEDTVSNS